jgi:hypothetical protein
MDDAIIINQSFWNRIKNILGVRAFNSASTLSLSGTDWHEVEKDLDGNKFRWSFPKTVITYENISALRVKLVCPVGREIHIQNDRIDFKHKLTPNKPYIFIINTVGTKDLTIETDPYMPENETRSLGLCFSQVCEHPSLACL